MPVVLWVVAAAFVALVVVALRFWAQARDAEHHLRLYRVAFEHAPDSGVVVLDRSLRVEFAAGPDLLAFGLEPATLGGRRPTVRRRGAGPGPTVRFATPSVLAGSLWVPPYCALSRNL